MDILTYLGVFWVGVLTTSLGVVLVDGSRINRKLRELEVTLLAMKESTHKVEYVPVGHMNMLHSLKDEVEDPATLNSIADLEKKLSQFGDFTPDGF